MWGLLCGLPSFSGDLEGLVYRSEASHTLLCIKPPQTQVSPQTLLTQNPQRRDPGIHIFESSPGDSRVQPQLRACTPSSRPGWPTNPLPVSLFSYSRLCL